MKTASPSVRTEKLAWFALLSVAALAFIAVGCGPSEEVTEQEEWEKTPTISPTARLEYQIDSLMNENKRMKDQLDAVSTENRSLRARIAELETKVAETATAAPTPPADMRPGYLGALDQFHARNYQGAIDQFQALLKGGIGSDLEDNCHYWIGESYYALKNYGEAIKEFETVLSYPQSGKKPYAQLMIGNANAAMGNGAAAREAYNAVVNGYPTSALVATAQEKLARLK
jgi:tol-pal system protein YbgF